MSCNSTLSSKTPNFITVVSMLLTSFWQCLEKQSMNKQPTLSVQYCFFKCKAKSLRFLKNFVHFTYSFLPYSFPVPSISPLFRHSFYRPFPPLFTLKIQFKCRPKHTIHSNNKILRQSSTLLFDLFSKICYA